jgi:hypothetical protein
MEGVPFTNLLEKGRRFPWSTVRHWLHDVAEELLAARRDHTLPESLSLNHVWVTQRGHAVLLDEPWPAAGTPAQRFAVGEIADEQRFLHAIAGSLEPTSVPLHARPVLNNLAEGRFEKLSFLTGVLRGLLDKPAEIDIGTRVGAIFLFPLYTWILGLAPCLTSREDAGGSGWEWLIASGRFALSLGIVILVVRAVVQLLELPFRTTISHSTFGLALIDAEGKPASSARRLLRWTFVWLPLFLPLGFLAFVGRWNELRWSMGMFLAAGLVLCIWIGAAVYAATHPHRGLHDQFAGTWVVRR